MCAKVWRRGRNKEHAASRIAASKAGAEATSEEDIISKFVLEIVFGSFLVLDLAHDW
jgi:hypothetical protein